jgi:transcription antitermination protein NusB
MPVVDRTVLRLATYELLYEATSAAVVINEALELAKSLSTEASGRYVNGVLEAIRKDLASRDEQDRPSA